jgi:hypothetical protein
MYIGGRGQLRLLNEPTTGDKILEKHNVPAAIEHDFVVATSNRLPPPFVIDTPILEDGFDGTVADCLTARPPDRRRPSVGAQLDCDGLRNVQGSKSINAYRRSGSRDHGCTSMT